MTIKAGYRTSEFWFTLVSFIFSGLYLLGIIGDNSQKEDLIRDVSHGVESCILIGGQLYILYKYIKGRTNIKEHAIDIVKRQEVNNNEPKRTSKRTSRKSNSTNKRVNKKSKKSSNR